MCCYLRFTLIAFHALTLHYLDCLNQSVFFSLHFGDLVDDDDDDNESGDDDEDKKK